MDLDILVLFDYGWYDKICERVKYLISEKMVLQLVLIIMLEESEQIHIIWYLQKKILTLHNIIILIKSVVSKNRNHYDYNIFLEKG